MNLLRLRLIVIFLYFLDDTKRGWLGVLEIDDLPFEKHEMGDEIMVGHFCNLEATGDGITEEMFRRLRFCRVGSTSFIHFPMTNYTQGRNHLTSRFR